MLYIYVFLSFRGDTSGLGGIEKNSSSLLYTVPSGPFPIAVNGIFADLAGARRKAKAAHDAVIHLGHVDPDVTRRAAQRAIDDAKTGLQLPRLCPGRSGPS